jgi:hypothetical protein
LHSLWTRLRVPLFGIAGQILELQLCDKGLITSSTTETFLARSHLNDLFTAGEFTFAGYDLDLSSPKVDSISSWQFTIFRE